MLVRLCRHASFEERFRGAELHGGAAQHVPMPCPVLDTTLLLSVLGSKLGPLAWQVHLPLQPALLLAILLLPANSLIGLQVSWEARFHMYRPVLHSSLAQVFKAARALAPAVVLIDEAERVFAPAKRGGKGGAGKGGGSEPPSRIKKALAAEVGRDWGWRAGAGAGLRCGRVGGWG